MKKISNILYKLLFVLFISINSKGNIIYDKNDLIITSFEIENFINIYNKNGKVILNDKDAIKKYVLIKKLIIKLKQKNPEILSLIDNELSKQFGDLGDLDLVFLDILRYQKIFLLYKKEYFEGDFNESELKNIFLKIKKLQLPISIDNCNTIYNILEFKDNDQFIKLFYSNIKENLNNYEIRIDNNKYTICMNNETFTKLEALIVNYLDNKINSKLKEFVFNK